MVSDSTFRIPARLRLSSKASSHHLRISYSTWPPLPLRLRGFMPCPIRTAMPTPLGRNSHRRQPSYPPHQDQQQQHCRCCTLAGTIASTPYPASPLYTADPDRYQADACAAWSCCPGAHRLVPWGAAQQRMLPLVVQQRGQYAVAMHTAIVHRVLQRHLHLNR